MDIKTLILPRPRSNPFPSQLKTRAFHIILDLTCMFENRTTSSLGENVAMASKTTIHYSGEITQTQTGYPED